MLHIEIDSGSGFCFGVTSAIKKAEDELTERDILYVPTSALLHEFGFNNTTTRQQLCFISKSTLVRASALA